MGMKKLKEKYKEQEEKIMYRLKSKYSSEKIEKLESILRYFCSFLLFVNMCTFMCHVNVFANEIEQIVKKEAETLLVVVSNEDSNDINDDMETSNENNVNAEETVDNEEKIDNQVNTEETEENEEQKDNKETVENENAVDNNETVENNTSEEDTKKIETNTIDNFSEVLSAVNPDNSLDSHKDNIYATKRLIVLSNKADFDNCEAISNISYGNMYVLSYDSEEKCKNAYETLKNNNDIMSVEIDAVMETEEESKEHQNEMTKMDSELKRYSDSLDVKNEVKVAILDTGIDTSKELFKDRLMDLGINVSSSGEENSILDDNGHGTEMATIICENSNSNVKLMPIKVANSSGKATILNTYIGIQKAIENGAKVINISMNTVVSASSQILTDIINEASDKGIIVVTSAGNNGADVKNYTPSNIEKAVVVSAIEDDNSFAEYSNFGETVDYCAYGKYNDKTGTSYAAATVTGILADLFSKDKGISDLDIYAIDLGDKGFDNYYGKGFIGYEYQTIHSDVEDEKEEYNGKDLSVSADHMYVNLGDENFDVTSNFTNLTYDKEYYDVEYISSTPEFDINTENIYSVKYKFINKEDDAKSVFCSRTIGVINDPEFVENIYSLSISADTSTVTKDGAKKYTALSHYEGSTSKPYSRQLGESYNLSSSNARAYLAISGLINCSINVDNYKITTWDSIVDYGYKIEMGTQSSSSKPTTNIDNYEYMLAQKVISKSNGVIKNYTYDDFKSVRDAIVELDNNKGEAEDVYNAGSSEYFTSDQYMIFKYTYEAFNEIFRANYGTDGQTRVLQGLGIGYGKNYNMYKQSGWTYSDYTSKIESDNRTSKWVPVTVLNDIKLYKGEVITIKFSGKNCTHVGVYGSIQFELKNTDGTYTSKQSNNFTIKVGTDTTKEETKTFVVPEDGTYKISAEGVAYGCEIAETYISVLSEYTIENATSYSITYKNMDGVTNTNPTSYTKHDEIKLVKPQKTGYTFKGWVCHDVLGIHTPTEDVTIPMRN